MPYDLDIAEIRSSATSSWTAASYLPYKSQVIIVKQMVSSVREPDGKKTRARLAALGLGRPNQISTLGNSHSNRATLIKVRHLVRILHPDETARDTRRADQYWREGLRRGGRPTQQNSAELLFLPKRFASVDGSPEDVLAQWLDQSDELISPRLADRLGGKGTSEQGFAEILVNLEDADPNVRRSAIQHSASLRRELLPAPEGNHVRRELPHRWYTHLFDNHADVARNAALALVSASQLSDDRAYSHATDVESLPLNAQVELRTDLEQLLASLGDQLFTYLELESIGNESSERNQVNLIGRLSRALPFELGGEPPMLPEPQWASDETRVLLRSESPNFRWLCDLPMLEDAQKVGDIAVARGQFEFEPEATSKSIMVVIEVPGRLREAHQFHLPI